MSLCLCLCNTICCDKARYIYPTRCIFFLLSALFYVFICHQIYQDIGQKTSADLLMFMLFRAFRVTYEKFSILKMCAK